MSNIDPRSHRMPRPWSLAVMVGVAIGLAPAGAGAAPKLSVPTLLQDLGELTAGETAEAEFPLRNTGAEALQIEQVKTSCGCTTVSYPATLQPGETGVLKVKLVSEPLWRNRVEKQIVLRSNDPEQPRVDLRIAADMRPLFRFAPANPIAIPYKKGEVLRQVVTVTAAEGSTFGLTGVIPGKPGAEGRLLPAVGSDPPGVWRVEITVRPPESGGDFSSFVLLQTTHPSVQEVPVSLSGRAQDVISLLPPRVRLGDLGSAAANTPPLIVTVYKRGGVFHVREIKTDTPALQAEVRALDPQDTANTFYEVAIRYVGGWPKGKTAGKILLTTDDPLVPQVEIPYDATVE